jgi:RNA polymerase sigma-70 factor, ECF subfamily
MGAAPAGTDSAILLREARDGSSEALGRLLEMCGEKLLALVRLRMGPELRGQLESRDVLQETMLKAFQRLDQFEGRDRDALMGWLAVIAWNEIRDRADHYRRLRRDQRLRVRWESGFDPVGRQLHSEVSRIALRDELRIVEAALERLGVDHREVILLRRFEELSFRQVAERLGRTEEAARKLYARAIAALTLEVRRQRGGGGGPV